MKAFWIQLTMAIFQLDWAVKEKVEYQMKKQEKREFLHGKVILQKLHNDGLAGGKHKEYLSKVTCLSACLVFAMLIGFFRLLSKSGHIVKKLGYSFLIGGSLSNLYDRCKKKYVVDYVSFRTPWKRLNHLVFNISDFFIMIGSILFALGTEETKKPLE